MPMTAPTISTPPRLEALFARVNPVRARLIFGVDATASRQPTWDLAAQLQGEMFAAVAAIDIQLIYYKGLGKCVASKWLPDARSLAAMMSRIHCAAGHTQIGRVLRHAHQENRRNKINALVVISDACEEVPADLYAEARELSAVPVFLFQEGADERV